VDRTHLVISSDDGELGRVRDDRAARRAARGSRAAPPDGSVFELVFEQDETIQ